MGAGREVVLVLVRHGESTWIAEGRFQGRLDPPLSPLGERQAALVGARLANRRATAPLPVPPAPPATIWHSPLTRAAATAAAIAARQPGGIPLRREPRFVELAQGDWEGLLHSEVAARWGDLLAAWRSDPTRAHAPGGETLETARRRVRAAVRDVVAELLGGAERGSETIPAPADSRSSHSPVPGYARPDRGTLVADPWAVVVAHDGIFRLALLSLLRLPLRRFWSFPFSLCGITVIAVRDGVASLRAHNLSDHLALLTDEPPAAEEARGERGGAL